MHSIFLALSLLTLAPSNPELTLSNICVEHTSGEYIVKYDLDFIGEKPQNFKVIVDFAFQEYETGIMRNIPYRFLSGDVGNKLIPLGSGHSITWNVSEDPRAPYPEGEIVLKAVLVEKKQTKSIKNDSRKIFQKENRLRKIYERLSKKGLTQEDIENHWRYKAVKNKIEVKKSLVSIESDRIVEDNNSYVTLEKFSVFTQCNFDVSELAFLSPSRPLSFSDLTDGISFRGMIYDKDKVTKLGLGDLFEFSASNKAVYSSFVYVRTKKDIVQHNNSKYEVTWGCGIMLNILFDQKKLKQFSSFKEASIFLKNNKNKYKFDFISLGLVGGRFEAMMATMQSKILEDPDEFIQLLGSLVQLWSAEDVTQTPRVISYRRIS